MLELTPVQLPEAGPRATEPMTMPEVILPDATQNIHFPSLPPADLTPPLRCQVAKPASPYLHKNIGPRLSERGTSSLTPVRERSEASNANISGSLQQTPEKTAGEQEKGWEGPRKKCKGRRGRKKLTLEKTQTQKLRPE